MTRSYTIAVHGEVKTVNATSKQSYWTHAKETAEWREMFGWQAKAQKIPTLSAVGITAFHWKRDNRLPDIGAAWYAIKAGIDGLVDAKVLVDDSPKYLTKLTLMAPENKGYDGLALEITEAES